MYRAVLYHKCCKDNNFSLLPKALRKAWFFFHNSGGHRLPYKASTTAKKVCVLSTLVANT